MPDQGFLDGKTISRGNNCTSLFMNHSCFCVGGWRVSRFSHLYFKCWQTRGRHLNSWNGYQKLYINRVSSGWRKTKLEKKFLGVLVLGHPYCLSINSSAFNVEHENTFPFHCHIGSSINNIPGHVLTCNWAKKIVL